LEFHLISHAFEDVKWGWIQPDLPAGISRHPACGKFRFPNVGIWQEMGDGCPRCFQVSSFFLWVFHIYAGLQEAGDSSDYSETWDVNELGMCGSSS